VLRIRNTFPLPNGPRRGTSWHGRERLYESIVCNSATVLKRI